MVYEIPNTFNEKLKNAFNQLPNLKKNKQDEGQIEHYIQ